MGQQVATINRSENRVGMASILFYTSIKTRVRDQESLMVAFRNQGHHVYFLNQQENKYLSSLCKDAGVMYSTIAPPDSASTLFRTMYYVRHLIGFIRSNKITLVYSHLEPANFIAVLIQYFVKARIVIVRHHHDLAARAGFDKDLSYRITYRLARKIITVSDATKKYMVEKEGIDGDKIIPIMLGYDFSVFGVVNESKAKVLREKLSNAVVLVTVGRLDKFKRPDVSLDVCIQLNMKGIKTHLFFLGEGQMESELKEKVQKHSLDDRVSFIGYADNVLDYLSVSDWLLHPSLSESSCVVVKEAGLVNLPAIVCQGVGDFDLFIRHGKNSMMVNPDTFVQESVGYITTSIEDKSLKEEMGVQLKKDVMTTFDIKSVLPEYVQFLQ